MSKRKATMDPVRCPKKASGILYLYQQLQELDSDASPFIVEAADITSWTVGMSSGALR